MPLIVGLLVRSIIQMAVTLGVISLAEKYILPLLNFAAEEVMTKFGVSEETAHDIISNELLKYIESIGIGVLLLRAKLPTIVAEKMGFTSKGWAMRNIIGVKTISTAVETNSTAVVAEKIATVTAKTAGVSFAKISEIIKLGATIVGVPTGVLYMAAQFIDYGSWSGSAYQGTFQKILSTFGLVPDRDARQPRTTSKDVFDKIFTAIKNEGGTGINDPYKNQTVLFSRNNLLDLTDKLASHILLETGKVTTQTLLGAILPLVIIKKADNGVTIADPAVAEKTKAPIVPVKVFTGIVSQGTLGAPVEFAPRENDLIESVDELKEAAQNNLAPFIQALPGKIIYEIKIVSSVTTKDGFRRTGEAQKVLSKYTAAGVPLYKTVVNKFAVLDISIMTDKLSKAKISSIVLGPTDAIKLQPKTNELKNIETSIKQDLFTSNISDITGIQTAQPITITTPPIQPAETIIAPAPAPSKPQYKITNEMYISRDGFDGYLYKATPEQLYEFVPREVLFTADEKKQFENFGASFDPTKKRLLEFGVNIDAMQRVQYFDKLPSRITSPLKRINTLEEFFGPAVVTAAPLSAKPASSTCLLQTLYEWYTTQGQSLPSVGQRTTLYESLGLGLASYYVGSAEQNTKLLNSLKRQNGCVI